MRSEKLILTLALFFTAVSLGGQVPGCPDPLAINYNPSATYNDGSCYYNSANYSPVATAELSETVSETSGLILWNNWLVTHNDNVDARLYCLDTLYGNIVQTFSLGTVENTDWEEISQDEDYIYIGDIGNNSGSRRDLKILRIEKASLSAGSPQIDSIMFSYSGQTDFTPHELNTDYDCEAFIVTNDSIYLFTKQWVNKRTRYWSLPKRPGTYSAKLRSEYDVDGMITGATFYSRSRIIVLTGYSGTLDPFLYLLYDFSSSDFFNGNKRRIDVSLPLHQIEGITTSNGIRYFVSNEKFSMFPLGNTPQKLHLFDLSPFLSNYLDINLPRPDTNNSYIILPVPAQDYLVIKSLPDRLPVDYFMIDVSGRLVSRGRLVSDNSVVSISGLAAGIYFLKIGGERRNSFKFIKE